MRAQLFPSSETEIIVSSTFKLGNCYNIWNELRYPPKTQIRSITDNNARLLGHPLQHILSKHPGQAESCFIHGQQPLSLKRLISQQRREVSICKTPLFSNLNRPTAKTSSIQRNPAKRGIARNSPYISIRSPRPKSNSTSANREAAFARRQPQYESTSVPPNPETCNQRNPAKRAIARSRILNNP